MVTTEGRAEYAPTQVLAELFRHKGFDGVAYQSGLGTEGYNIALFDPDCAIVSMVWVYKVDTLKAKVSRDEDAEVKTVAQHSDGLDLLATSIMRIGVDARAALADKA